MLKLGSQASQGASLCLAHLMLCSSPGGSVKSHLKKMKEFLGVAFFPSIRHGPHRKRRPQQFFVAKRSSSPTCYPSNDRQSFDEIRTADAPNNYFLHACVRCRGNEYNTRDILVYCSEPLSSNADRETYTHSGSWAVEMSSDAMTGVRSS
jgi:hypothetical protein